MTVTDAWSFRINTKKWIDLIIQIYLAENFKVFKQTALESNNVHDNSFFVWKDNIYYLVG